MTQDIFAAIAKAKGRAEPAQAAAPDLPFAAAAERARQETLAALRPGDAAPDGTVYLGLYRPCGRDGFTLRKTFRVFAAPRDIGEMRYDDAVASIAALENWHGHDGAHYASDAQIYDALAENSYRGGWIMPPIELVTGKDIAGRASMPDNLTALCETGAFKGSFGTAQRESAWYWSSTETRDDARKVHNAILPLKRASGSRALKDGDRTGYCRPVRLEPV